MSLLVSLIVNFLSAVLSYYLIQDLILKNIKIPDFLEFFNSYGLMSVVLLLFYLKNRYQIFLFEGVILLVFLLYYLRSYNAARKKIHEKFKAMILSFGYTREGYFDVFLSKKLLIRGVESFFFGLGVYYMFDSFFRQFLMQSNLHTIVFCSILFAAAAQVKNNKGLKIYKNN